MDGKTDNLFLQEEDGVVSEWGVLRRVHRVVIGRRGDWEGLKGPNMSYHFRRSPTSGLQELSPIKTGVPCNALLTSVKTNSSDPFRPSTMTVDPPSLVPTTICGMLLFGTGVLFPID